MASTFLEKLWTLLDDEALSSVISWQADGQSFIIKKPQELEEQVLPKYFKHNNIQSFIRQLNMYNFSKTSHDSNYREFKQTMFRRDRRDLLVLIKRKSQATSGQSLPNGSMHSPQTTGWDNSSNIFSEQSGLLGTLISSMPPPVEGIAELLQLEDLSASEGEAEQGTDASMKLKILSLQNNIRALNERYNNLAKNYNIIYSYLFGSGSSQSGESGQPPPIPPKRVGGGSTQSDSASEGEVYDLSVQGIGFPDYSHLLSMPLQGSALCKMSSRDSVKSNKSSKGGVVVHKSYSNIGATNFSRQNSKDAYGAFSRQNSKDAYGTFSRQNSRDGASYPIIKPDFEDSSSPPLTRHNSIYPFDYLPEADPAATNYPFGGLLSEQSSVDDATYRAATSLVSMVSVDAESGSVESMLRKRKVDDDAPLLTL